MDQQNHLREFQEAPKASLRNGFCDHQRRVRFEHVKHIGEIVTKEDTILYVDEIPVCASIDGVLRGLIREISVEKNEKVGDIDPRGQVALCYSISDKARAIGNGVLEAIMRRYG